MKYKDICTAYYKFCTNYTEIAKSEEKSYNIYYEPDYQIPGTGYITEASENI